MSHKSPASAEPKMKVRASLSFQHRSPSSNEGVLGILAAFLRSGDRLEEYGRVYAFIATSVRFFAFIFLMTLRTWTFTVLKHIFSSCTITLFDLPP